MLASALNSPLRVIRLITACFVSLVLVISGAQIARAQGQPPAIAFDRQGSVATFKAGVEVVSVAAAVRDSRGRVVRDLRKADFQVIDSGAPRDIRDFYAGEAAISLAILLDISGSMAVGGNMDRARHAVTLVTAGLTGSGDEAGLYTFDATLREVVGFTTDLNRIRSVNLEGRPWGTTSLYDAVANAARTVADRANRHRALLVITDGVDTASQLTAPEVSGIAASIDVPVYLLTVVNPLDHPGGELSVVAADGAGTSVATLADLARWTGGDMHVASTPGHTVQAVRELFSELRYQYLIVFEPDVRPGWHPLEIRPRNKNLTVHARGGYMSGPARSAY